MHLGGTVGDSSAPRSRGGDRHPRMAEQDPDQLARAVARRPHDRHARLHVSTSPPDFYRSHPASIPLPGPAHQNLPSRGWRRPTSPGRAGPSFPGNRAGGSQRPRRQARSVDPLARTPKRPADGRRPGPPPDGPRPDPRPTRGRQVLRDDDPTWIAGSIGLVVDLDLLGPGATARSGGRLAGGPSGISGVSGAHRPRSKWTRQARFRWRCGTRPTRNRFDPIQAGEVSAIKASQPGVGSRMTSGALPQSAKPRVVPPRIVCSKGSAIRAVDFPGLAMRAS